MLAAKLKALRNERNEYARQHLALVENTGTVNWTQDKQKEASDLADKITSLEEQINQVQIALDNSDGDIKDVTRKPVKPTDSQAMTLFNRWMRGGDTALSADEWQQIRNTMSTTTDSEGGYTVPDQVMTSIVDAMKAFGGMRSVATVVSASNGQQVSWPTSDGTSEVGELIAENTTATAADPSFGTVALVTYKFSSKIVAVPFELLQDSVADMESFVQGRLATRLGRTQNAYFTTGTGSSQPRGVVTGSTLGKTGASGQTTSVIYADIVDLIHSLDPAYRQNCRFMMNDSTVKAIRKLVDGSSRPLWVPSYDAGITKAQPETLHGYPVVINQDVEAMAASKKSILFGDFSKYIIRDVMSMQLFRFTDSAYAKLGQVGFLMWMRTGGQLIDTAAVKHYINAAS